MFQAGELNDHLLVSKVLRKVKDRHDVRVSDLEALQDQLLSDWSKLDDTMPERCGALIEQEIRAKRGEDAA